MIKSILYRINFAACRNLRIQINSLSDCFQINSNRIALIFCQFFSGFDIKCNIIGNRSFFFRRSLICCNIHFLRSSRHCLSSYTHFVRLQFSRSGCRFKTEGNKACIEICLINSKILIGKNSTSLRLRFRLHIIRGLPFCFFLIFLLFIYRNICTAFIFITIFISICSFINFCINIGGIFIFINNSIFSQLGRLIVRLVFRIILFILSVFCRFLFLFSQNDIIFYDIAFVNILSINLHLNMTCGHMKRHTTIQCCEGTVQLFLIIYFYSSIVFYFISQSVNGRSVQSGSFERSIGVFLCDHDRVCFNTCYSVLAFCCYRYTDLQTIVSTNSISVCGIGFQITTINTSFLNGSHFCFFKKKGSTVNTHGIQYVFAFNKNIDSSIQTGTDNGRLASIGHVQVDHMYRNGISRFNTDDIGRSCSTKDDFPSRYILIFFIAIAYCICAGILFVICNSNRRNTYIEVEFFKFRFFILFVLGFFLFTISFFFLRLFYSFSFFVILEFALFAIFFRRLCLPGSDGRLFCGRCYCLFRSSRLILLFRILSGSLVLCRTAGLFVSIRSSSITFVCRRCFDRRRCFFLCRIRCGCFNSLCFLDRRLDRRFRSSLFRFCRCCFRDGFLRFFYLCHGFYRIHRKFFCQSYKT